MEKSIAMCLAKPELDKSIQQGAGQNAISVAKQSGSEDFLGLSAVFSMGRLF
ncbi:hypothetical protein [Methylomonas methanica]|uniref:hypothetical protein n=1 Tax=Methylomonas methanica TaxID=421 RepID=UPI0013050BA0|nr:hypothetical protein [Methylomonas methanica]